MNLRCLICSDLFTPHAEIYTTSCGHLFHYHCLMQWIERSRSCPQCRSKSTEKTIHKVYLSVEEAGETTTDAGMLQVKLDNLQFQMNLREMDIKNVREKYEVAKKQTIGLREEVKSQESKTRVVESAMHALEDQVKYFKSKYKECDKLQDEVRRLKDRLKSMQHVETVITGTREQVSDMLRHNHDPQSLAILVSTLKKELMDSDRQRKHTQNRLKEAHNESYNYKAQLAQLNKHNAALQQEMEAHKHCEAERQYLKHKLNEVASKAQTDSPNAVNTSIRRIVTESPVPLVKLTKLQDEAGTKHASPSVPEQVQAIKDSDSPYLRLQSSGLGLPGLLNFSRKFESQPSSSASTANSKLSIFKRPSSQAATLRRPSTQICYDGLGGHAKDDEFPRPQQASLKRSKSSSTVTSAKFRKLAPQKKLNEFFSDSQPDCTK